MLPKAIIRVRPIRFRVQDFVLKKRALFTEKFTLTFGLSFFFFYYIHSEIDEQMFGSRLCTIVYASELRALLGRHETRNVSSGPMISPHGKGKTVIRGLPFSCCSKQIINLSFSICACHCKKSPDIARGRRVSKRMPCQASDNITKRIQFHFLGVAFSIR